VNLPPMPQQKIMTDFLIRNAEAAVFACPGLGKSRAVIDALKHLMADGQVRGATVVAPLRVTTLTWPGELEKWGGLTFASLRTEEGVDAWHNGSADVYLINYEMLATREVTRNGVTKAYPNFISKCLKKKKSVPGDLLVWDEITRMKSPANKAGKEFMPYRGLFKRHIGLTGTPQPNSCLDLFAQIKLLDGGKRLGTAFSNFRGKYATSDYMGYKWEINPGSQEAIQEAISDMTLVLRDTDYLNIPPVTYEDIDITLSPPELKAYKRFQRDMLAIHEGKEVVALSAATLVQKLSQYASGASYYMNDETRGVVPIHNHKIKALTALHERIGHRPLLVLTQFQHEVDRILDSVPHAKAFDDRKLDDWNAGKIPMWVAHPKSMSHGLQMQGVCCNVCWFTLGYSWEDYKQANARVARTGQSRPTTIYRLLVADTVDWVQAEVIRGKGEGESALKLALNYIKKLDNQP